MLLTMDGPLTFFVVVSSLIGLDVKGCDVGLWDTPSCSIGQIDSRNYVSKVVLPFCVYTVHVRVGCSYTFIPDSPLWTIQLSTNFHMQPYWLGARTRVRFSG